ncbi:hypothetical protein WDU94_012862 [Cyamophila willieti]
MIEHYVIRHCNKTTQQNMLYYCNPCNEGFNRKARFEQHKVIRHQFKFEYYCFICNKSYHRGAYFSEHMDLHSGLRYTCVLCGKNVTSAQNLQFHLDAVHYQQKNHTCDTCGKGFALRKQLREHERVHTGYAPAKCKICNKTFALYANLNAHLNKHKQGLKYKCTNCSSRFTYLSNMIRHRRIKHSQRKGRYVCNSCGKYFIDKRDYENHISVHYTRLMYTQRDCKLCMKSYKVNTSLTRHIKFKHVLDRQNNFTSSYCSDIGRFIPLNGIANFV